MAPHHQPHFDPVLTCFEMIRPINAFCLQDPTVVSSIESPTLPWRCQEIRLELTGRRPAVAVEYIKVNMFPHLLTPCDSQLPLCIVRTERFRPTKVTLGLPNSN